RPCRTLEVMVARPQDPPGMLTRPVAGASPSGTPRPLRGPGLGRSLPWRAFRFDPYSLDDDAGDGFLEACNVFGGDVCVRHVHVFEVMAEPQVVHVGVASLCRTSTRPAHS